MSVRPQQQALGLRGSQIAGRPRRPPLWLRLTSYGWDKPLATLQQRELARRSRLASWIILGLFVGDLVLLPIGIGDTGSLVSALVAAAGLAIAAVFNRRGRLALAGGVLVVIIDAALMNAIVSQGQLATDTLQSYYLFSISVVVAASVLPRIAAFIAAVVNIGLMCLDFFLQPYYTDLQADIRSYSSTTEAIITLLARPIALQVILAVVSYLWVRGTDDALRRADRAEEVAALEHQIAEQMRQLDIGIQQILQTHVRAANGDFSARAPLAQDNLLWQIAYSLNNLLARVQRTGQVEHQLQRTEDEIRRLVAAIDDAQAGKPPLWPAPSGTAVDLVLERIKGAGQRGSRLGRQAQQVAPPPPMPPLPSVGEIDGNWDQPGSQPPTSNPRGPYEQPGRSVNPWSPQGNP